MKGGLLRLVKDIRELRAPKGLIGFVCPTLSLRRKSTDWRDQARRLVRRWGGSGNNEGGTN